MNLSKQIEDFKFFIKSAKLIFAKIAECTYTCCACYSSFPIIASAVSLNGNRRQSLPCLPKSETTDAAGGVSSSSSQYGGENAIQFSGKERNAEAEIIVAFIKEKIDEFKNIPVGGVVQQISPAEELKKCKELLDLGIITQEEFDAKKKELLGL